MACDLVFYDLVDLIVHLDVIIPVFDFLVDQDFILQLDGEGLFVHGNFLD